MWTSARKDMLPTSAENQWFWLTLVLSGVTIIAAVFAIWELVENSFFAEVDYVTLHYFYITRGIVLSLVIALWAAWFVLRQQQWTREQLQRPHEWYRGLVEASPGAAALYDAALHVTEWNAAAERLYGFSKSDVQGRILPTLPSEKEVELQQFLQKVNAGEPVLDVETLRQNKQGSPLKVQLSLLPLPEEDGQKYFLEVTADIRPRVRMTRKVLEKGDAASPKGPQPIAEGNWKPRFHEEPFPTMVTGVNEQALSIEQVERLAIERALRLCRGNRTKAAGLLGISRDTLYRRLRLFKG